MIRLNDAVLTETTERGGCNPLESFLIGQRMTMWPVFQKEMNAHVESLKKLGDSAAGGLLTKSTLKDATVHAVCFPVVISCSM